METALQEHFQVLRFAKKTSKKIAWHLARISLIETADLIELMGIGPSEPEFELYQLRLVEDLRDIETRVEHNKPD